MLKWYLNLTYFRGVPRGENAITYLIHTRLLLGFSGSSPYVSQGTFNPSIYRSTRRQADGPLAAKCTMSQPTIIWWEDTLSSHTGIKDEGPIPEWELQGEYLLHDSANETNLCTYDSPKRGEIERVRLQQANKV